MAVLPFFKEKPCSVRQRLAKVTFLAMLPDGSRTKEFYENIPDERWEISSFDPATRNVCVRLTTLHGSENLAATKLGHLAPTNKEEEDTTQANNVEVPVTTTELLISVNELVPQAISTASNQPQDLSLGIPKLPAF